MIDWTTISLPLLHTPIPSGSVVKLCPSGSIEWESPSRVSVTGSFSASVCVRSRGVLDDESGKCSILEISGNPSKFLQGHNVFGSDNLCLLVSLFVFDVCRRLYIPLTDFDKKSISSGEYSISRVDLTYSFSLPSRSDVRSFIRALDYKSRTRRGKGVLNGSTLYHGKHSRRWSFKFYCKGDEIQKHPLPTDLNFLDSVSSFADRLLRVELTLRSLELKKLGLSSGFSWLNFNPFSVWSDYLRRIDMTSQLVLPDDLSLNLRPAFAASYHRWKDGVDLRSIMKEPTFYRHRSFFLSLGIDISIPPDDVTDFSNVVPLIRYLEAKPVPVPSWAFGTSLIAC